MAAIITDTFRRNNAKLFISDIANRFNTNDLGHYDSLISNDSLTPIDNVISPVIHTNKYYLGIGRSDKWSETSAAIGEESLNFNIPSPMGSFSDNIEVFNNLATLRLLDPTNTSIVIPTVPWIAGSIYRVYSSYDSSCFYSGSNGVLPCYVTVPDDGIYMCLRSPGTPTTDNSLPLDITSSYAPIATRDGYVWVLVQKFNNYASEFITDQFVEVRRTALESDPVTFMGPLTTCRNASGGLVTGFNIANGNGGIYVGGTPTVWLRGTDGLSYENLTSTTQYAFSTPLPASHVFTTNIVASATAFSVGQTVRIVNTSVGDSSYAQGTITSFTGTQLNINITYKSPTASGSPVTWKFVIQGVPNTGGAKTSDDQLELDVTMENGSISSVALKPGSYPLNTSGTITGSFPKGFLATSCEIRLPIGVTESVKAQIVPIMTPFNGLGYNPSDVLPAWYAGISVSLNGNITQPGDTSPDNFYTPYRQISIIKNANASNQITVNALRSLTLTSAPPQNFDVNANVIMTDASNEALPLAIVDYVETIGSVSKIYFHQNYTTGYREMPIPTGSTPATIKIAGVAYSYNEINQSELSNITTDIHGNPLIFNGYPYYGEVIFVENRKKVVRAMNQNEKIKIIIQF